jgi:hypothetical protein
MAHLLGKECLISWSKAGTKAYRTWCRKHYLVLYADGTTNGWKAWNPFDIVKESTEEKGTRLSIIKAIADRNERISAEIVQRKAWVKECIKSDVGYFDGYHADDYDALELAIL